MSAARENRFYFFAMVALVLILGYLTYLILKPFLNPIAWGIVFAIVFYPLYSFLLRYVRWSSVAALLAVVIILLLILGPFSYFSYLLASELSNISVKQARLESLAALLDHPYIKPVVDKVLSLVRMTPDQFHMSITENLALMGKSILRSARGGLGDVMGAAFSFVLMAFCLFFFLKDGADFLTKVRDYVPFSREQKARLAQQVKDIVISTIYGGVAVALVEGIVGAIGFAVVGIHSPVLWGLAISICSFIPVIGATIVWVPAVFYLLLTFQIVKGIILAIIGVLGISTVDNIMRPIIIRGRIRMPLLVIFFSVLGGIQLFGLIGLILGPLVVAVFVSVVDIFRATEEGT